jgi:HD-like signal output (HDOD) protein
MGVSVITPSSVRAQTLRCLDSLPKMSPMLTQLLAQLSHPNCEIHDLAETVERDPMLSGQILRLANSAIFGRLRPVSSVRHAIAMIGTSALRKFALGSSISNLFSRTKLAKHFSLRRFNVHSVATATLLELLSEELPFESGEDAFLAGLMHDIGKLLVAASFPQQYDDILALTAVNGATLIAAERDILGIDHAELSSLAILRWELSEAIQSAACNHHQPGESAGRPGLSLGIHHADAYINHLGMSVLPLPLPCQKADTLEIPGFAFSQERVLRSFEQEIETLGNLFR